MRTTKHVGYDGCRNSFNQKGTLRSAPIGDKKESVKTEGVSMRAIIGACSALHHLNLWINP